MTDPLFVPRATLVANLRLSEATAAAQPETVALIDRAILQARLVLLRQLGSSLVAQLQNIARNEIDPETEDEQRRMIAETLEIDSVLLVLSETMPQLFQDAGAKALQVWNDEGTFRGQSHELLEDFRETVRGRIRWALEQLLGVCQGDTGESFVSAKPCDATYPFESSDGGVNGLLR